MDGYKIDGRLINSEDPSSIITALKGFLTAYDNSRYNGVLTDFTTEPYRSNMAKPEALLTGLPKDASWALPRAAMQSMRLQIQVIKSLLAEEIMIAIIV
jgi:hypothetical protein